MLYLPPTLTVTNKLYALTHLGTFPNKHPSLVYSRNMSLDVNRDRILQLCSALSSTETVRSLREYARGMSIPRSHELSKANLCRALATHLNLVIDDINEDEVEVPEELMDPVSFEPLYDPYVASDGQSYNQDTLRRLLSERRPSPITREPLNPGVHTFNRSLRNVVLKWLIENGQEVHDAEPTWRDPSPAPRLVAVRRARSRGVPAAVQPNRANVVLRDDVRHPEHRSGANQNGERRAVHSHSFNADTEPAAEQKDASERGQTDIVISVTNSEQQWIRTRVLFEQHFPGSLKMYTQEELQSQPRTAQYLNRLASFLRSRHIPVFSDQEQATRFLNLVQGQVRTIVLYLEPSVLTVAESPEGPPLLHVHVREQRRTDDRAAPYRFTQFDSLGIEHYNARAVAHMFFRRLRDWPSRLIWLASPEEKSRIATDLHVVKSADELRSEHAADIRLSGTDVEEVIEQRVIQPRRQRSEEVEDESERNVRQRRV